MLVQFATQWSARWLVAGTGLALTGLAAAMAVLACRQWRATEIAMRHARPLPPGAAIGVLTAGVALGASARRG